MAGRFGHVCFARPRQSRGRAAAVAIVLPVDRSAADAETELRLGGPLLPRRRPPLLGGEHRRRRWPPCRDVLGCYSARMTGEAKRRRQERVCSAASPGDGLIDARSGCRTRAHFPHWGSDLLIVHHRAVRRLGWFGEVTLCCRMARLVVHIPATTLAVCDVCYDADGVSSPETCIRSTPDIWCGFSRMRCGSLPAIAGVKTSVESRTTRPTGINP